MFAVKYILCYTENKECNAVMHCLLCIDSTAKKTDWIINSFFGPFVKGDWRSHSPSNWWESSAAGNKISSKFKTSTPARYVFAWILAWKHECLSHICRERCGYCHEKILGFGWCGICFWAQISVSRSPSFAEFLTYLYNIITAKECNIPYCVIHKYPANVHLRCKIFGRGLMKTLLVFLERFCHTYVCFLVF